MKPIARNQLIVELSIWDGNGHFQLEHYLISWYKINWSRRLIAQHGQCGEMHNAYSLTFLVGVILLVKFRIICFKQQYLLSSQSCRQMKKTPNICKWRETDENFRKIIICTGCQSDTASQICSVRHKHHMYVPFSLCTSFETCTQAWIKKQKQNCNPNKMDFFKFLLITTFISREKSPWKIPQNYSSIIIKIEILTKFEILAFINHSNSLEHLTRLSSNCHETIVWRPKAQSVCFR